MLAIQKFYEITKEVTCHICHLFMFEKSPGVFYHHYTIPCLGRIVYCNDNLGIDIYFENIKNKTNTIRLDLTKSKLIINSTLIPIDNWEDIKTEKDLLNLIQLVSFYI